MRDNNLNKVEKNLKYLARRYRSIKYSLGLAILFLMMGISAFSGEVNGVPTREEIAASKNSFKSSVESLQSKIKEAKEENEKIVFVFSATWCPDCIMLDRYLEETMNKFP